MVQEHERTLPIANVGRIMRQILPPSAKISKEAKETMQECTTEFVSFVTAEASEKCNKENRRTVNGDHICWSLSPLGFDFYTEVMLRYLHKYRQCETQKAKQCKASNDENETFTDPTWLITDSECANLQPDKQSETPVTMSLQFLKRAKALELSQLEMSNVVFFSLVDKDDVMKGI